MPEQVKILRRAGSRAAARQLSKASIYRSDARGNISLEAGAAWRARRRLAVVRNRRLA